MTTPDGPRRAADSLSPELWAHIRALVEGAVALAPELRGAFLSSSCGNDDGLRDRVERLVSASDRATGAWGFLAHPAGEFAAPLIAADETTRADPARSDGAPAAFCAALADRYAVGAELGRGGMATVYEAEDLRHHRRVAIKVLDPHLGALLGAERFLAEIRVTAGLQHPNLLPLFDSGEAVGLLYYVMPLIQGATLRARLRRERQLPVDETVRIVCAVAEALDYAHRQGVVHRDLKPENILLQDGQPLVADFGIALAVSRAGGARVTQTGLALGTPQYMSPEQATGDGIIDGRSDIYSLAAVAYETLTGQPPHVGASAQAVVARVLTERAPGVRVSRPAVPEHVDLAINRALEKLPADRWPTAATFATALVTPGRAAPQRAGTFLRRVLPWAGVSLVLAVLGFVWGAWAMRPPTVVVPDQPVVRDAIDLQPGERLYFDVGMMMAISPHGDRLVYSARGTAGVRLMIRPTGDMNARVLVSGAVRVPAFSPDGRWVVYADGSQIQKVSVDGGPSRPLAKLSDISPRGFVWLANDTILVGSGSGMFALPSKGGAMHRVLGVDSTAEAAFPVTLPDGKTIAYVSGTAASTRLTVMSLASHSPKVFEDIAATMALGMLEGHLLYVTSSGELNAVPFDLEGQSVGEEIQLETGIRVSRSTAYASLSASGSMWFLSGANKSHLVRVAAGRPDTPLIEEAHTFLYPRFSPGGGEIAVEVGETNGSRIWLYDLASGGFAPITATVASNTSVEWSGDGKRILFRSTHEGRPAIMWQPAYSGAKAELLYQPKVAFSEAILSRDSKWLVYRTGPGPPRDIFGVPLDGDREPVPLVGGPTNEQQPRLSNDGKWLAYQSNDNDSSRLEIYVRPFPGFGTRVQVSNQGGTEPLWARSGNAIFYRTAGGGIEYASVTTTGTRFTVGERRAALLSTDYQTSIWHTSYDVFPDGSSFLMLKPVDADDRPILVHNWVRILREKVKAVPSTAR